MSTESANYVDQFKALEQHRQILIAGIALAIVGSFLPWYSYGSAGSTLGIETDGLVTLLVAGAGAAGIHYEGWTERVLLGCLAAGALVALLALSARTSAASIGIYLTLFGGIAMAVGGYLCYDELAE